MANKNAPDTEPGAELATSEELLPGHGTYDDGQHIRAAAFGTKIIDSETMSIHVATPRGVPVIEKGDIVVGQVTFVKPELASVQILAVRGKEGRSMHHVVEATLRVANVADRYVREMGDEIKVGDVLRAKVIGTRGGPQLAIDKPDLGVIKAFSKDDPTRALVRKGNRLVDPEDGHQETRKFADDYGSGRV